MGIHTQIIPLTGNVLSCCYANRLDYSIKRYAIKWAINARKSTFGFWFSTFYPNKRGMQLSGMRLTGFYCTTATTQSLTCHVSATSDESQAWLGGEL